MDEWKKAIGQITRLDLQAAGFLGAAEKMEDIYAAFSQDRDAFLLLSGDQGDCSRYSFLCCDPFLAVSAWGTRIELRNRAGAVEITGNPFDLVQDILESLEIPALSHNLPFQGGAVGYWGYDLRYHLEKLPDLAQNDLSLPDLYLIFPGVILIYDRQEERYHLVTIEHRLPGEATEKGSAKIARLRAKLSKAPGYAGRMRAGGVTGPNSNFTAPAYLAAVKRVQEYIRQGDVYQVNLSQRFLFPFAGSPYPLFRALFARNPAPFYAYLNCGDFCVLSTSPERFLWRQGNYIETRPIKGTRPRRKDAGEDKRMKKELLESPKEEAELSMIVDLLRNDLGKVCLPGTIQVKKHKRVEAYQNVFHLVSIVAGRLRQECTQMDILKAVFPGGSITGCPKIRAMEIIEELEPVKRGIYTGAIGYVGWPDTLNLSIAIRTAVYKNQQVYLSVGGGIVYNSDPEAEYRETLHKGETFFDLLHQMSVPGERYD